MDNRLIVFATLVFAAVVAKLVSPRIYAVLKPLPLVFLLVLAFLKPVFPPALWLAALLCGLAGDLWLLSARGFIPGLISFLLGHIFYIFALERQSAVPGVSVVTVFAVASVSTLAFAYFAQHLFRARNRMFILPIFLYIGVTALLLLSALKNPLFSGAALGAILFAASDFLLAFNKFIRPTLYVQVVVLLTYYAAQWLLAVHFGAIGGF